MNIVENRISFLVGAGLVYSAGLPLSVQLVTKLKELLITEAGNFANARDVQSKAKLFLSTLYFLNGAVRFQQGVCNRDPDADVNIEQIAVAAIELQARLENPLAPYASGWHGRVVELENKDPKVLTSFIEFIYSKLTKWLTFETLERISYLARLSDFAAIADGIDIFSLNYDLCIESALSDLNKSFENGFTEEGWEPNRLANSDEKIRLYKVHGSLDWVDDELYGLCSMQFPRHQSAEDIEGEHQPLLIFGVAHKLTAREPFLTLAYQFSQSVSQTPVLVVIGYSFGDDYVNDIIYQGLRRNPRLRIVIVAPDAEQIVQRNPQLREFPRVVPIDGDAKVILEDSSLFRRVRELLEETTSEEPF